MGEKADNFRIKRTVLASCVWPVVGNAERISVAREFKSIHHLGENIHFYLGHCFSKIEPEQIFAVCKPHMVSG